MMKLELIQCDILDVPVDILICSGNVSLNLSGGVGGELLLRYGPSLQVELHQHLPKQAPRFARAGDVVVTYPAGTPYKAVLHAIAVDAFYDSNVALITGTVRSALTLASNEGARSVAITALATGFGRLSIAQFADGIRPVLFERFPPIEKVVVAIHDGSAFQELRNALPEGQIVAPMC